jgi:hypothetical protein
MFWLSRRRLRQRACSPSRRGRATVRLSLEQLEWRQAPAVLTVNSLGDDNTADNVLTLREAILVVNGHLGRTVTSGEQGQISGGAVGTNDTIQFAPSLAGQTIHLTASDSTGVGRSAFAIKSSLTIKGDGTSGITITRDSASSKFRFFVISKTGSLTLQNLTLSNGLAQEWSGGASGAAGGGGGWVGRHGGRHL